MPPATALWLLGNISAMRAEPAGLQAPSPRAIPILSTTSCKVLSARLILVMFMKSNLPVLSGEADEEAASG